MNPEEQAKPPSAQECDFLDFGASTGGSLKLGYSLLGGVKGLGVDIDPAKVATMHAAGLDCIEGDLTELDWPSQSVRFVLISHLLEHLDSREQAKAVIASAVRVASEWIYIAGPWYDEDEYLEDLGLRPYWSNWSGHRYHMTTRDLGELLRELGAPNFRIWGRDRMYDSEDKALHSLMVARNQHEFDPEVHPPKPVCQFDRPIYREFVCCVRLDDISDTRWELLLSRVQRMRKAERAPRTNWESRALEEKDWSGVGRKVQEKLRVEQALLLAEGAVAFLDYMHLREELQLGADSQHVVLVGATRPLRRVLSLEFAEMSFDFVPAKATAVFKEADLVARLREAPSVQVAKMATEWRLGGFQQHSFEASEGSVPTHSEEVVAALQAAVDQYSVQALQERIDGLRRLALLDVVWSERKVTLGPTRTVLRSKK